MSERADDTGRDSVPSAADPLRSLQDLANQVAASAQSMAKTVGSAMPASVAGPLARYSGQLAALTTWWSGPLRALLEDQRRLADLMDAWAAQHKLLSEQIASWAAQQRQISEHMAGIVAPVLDQTDRVAEFTRSWGEKRDG